MHEHDVKADFDSIYDLDDPREYFKVLGSLNYRVPEHGRKIFALLVEARERIAEDVNVLDPCCSYGINAALCKYEMTLNDLYERYGSKELALLSSEELACDDVSFYAKRKREKAPWVTGLDSARSAVSYALEAKLLDAGFAENLEKAEPSGSFGKAASRADLITVTGGISYITERTFDRLLSRMRPEDLLWVASFQLRSVSYKGISEALSRHGLITEKLRGRTFDQRRFVSLEEREQSLRKLADMGIDASGKEDEGVLHTDFYLSRPPHQTTEVSIEDLLAPAL